MKKPSIATSAMSVALLSILGGMAILYNDNSRSRHATSLAMFMIGAGVFLWVVIAALTSEDNDDLRQ